MQIDVFFFKVGLDPLLREKIWDFLVETTRTSKLAVIITTHYIEEAKQANCVSYCLVFV
jgi:ABC-type multidrug transport system ATPase subunit